MLRVRGVSDPIAFPAAIDFGEIGRLVLASFIAGVGVTACFSFLLLGVTRAGESHAAGRQLPLVLYVALAVVGLAGTGLAIYLSIEILTSNPSPQEVS